MWTPSADAPNVPIPVTTRWDSPSTSWSARMSVTPSRNTSSNIARNSVSPTSSGNNGSTAAAAGPCWRTVVAPRPTTGTTCTCRSPLGSTSPSPAESPAEQALRHGRQRATPTSRTPHHGGVSFKGTPPFSTTDEQNERTRSEEHTSELQSRENLVCRLLLDNKQLSHRADAMRARQE